MVNSAVPESKDSGRKLFFGLFIFPLVIAVGMAILLCTVVLLTREVETPESLITSIKTGSPSKRWQKAFELSNELNQGRGMIRESGVMKEIVHILSDRREYDAKTRSFMAIALGHFDQPEAVKALRETLRSETEVEVQLYLIWSLGVRQVGEAADDIEPFLRNENVDLRKMAAYVAGVLENPTIIPSLEPLLDDKVRDVRWNSALALARLGSNEGYEEITKMLDRKTLASLGDLSEAKIEEIMINAVKGLVLVEGKDKLAILKQLSKEDPSLKVRQVALEALKQ